MAELNLLPKDRAAGKEVSRAAGLLRKISLSFGAIFLAVTGVGGAFLFLSISSLNGVRAEYDQAAAQVQNLQATEASLVFLKDRLQKSQTVLSARSVEESFFKQKEILTNAPEPIVFKESEVNASSSTLEVTALSSADLASLMSGLLVGGNLSSLIMKELSFSALVGYTLLLEVY